MKEPSAPGTDEGIAATSLGVLDELVVFLLDDKTRRIHLDDWTLQCVLGGAALLDLMLDDRIAISRQRLGRVSLSDDTPTGNVVLDRVLAAIADDPRQHSVQHWVEWFADHVDRASATVLSRLARLDIVRTDLDGNHAIAEDVLNTGKYPAPLCPGHSLDSVRVRLPGIVDGTGELELHDVALICLVHVCGGLQRQFTPEQMVLARSQLQAIRCQDSSCTDVANAVRRCFADIVVRPSQGGSIPKIKIRDFLSPTMRRGDLGRWFAELAGKYGPVFELPQPGNRQVVLASAEANHWAERDGWKYLRAKDYVTGYEEVYGCPGSILSADGPEHAHLRGLVHKRGQLAVLEERIDDVYGLCRQHFGRWVSGGVQSTHSEMLMLMGKVIAEIGLGIGRDDFIPGLKDYEERAVKTQIMGILPGFMMHTRKMRRIRTRLDGVVDEIVGSHTGLESTNRPRDIADEILLQHRADPHALPANHLNYAFLSVLIAGQNLGNLLSFAVYELLDNPRLLDAIRAEADACFKHGDPSAEELSTDTVAQTERFFMEVCRLHPVGAGSLRTAKNGFELCGKRIPPGSSLLIAFAAPHYFEEHWRDRDKFDPDRFAPSRAEHLAPGVYAPFGCDAHRCPMHRWTRLLLIVNLLLLAHHLNLEASPPGYRLRKSAYPTTSPHSSFKFRVASVRNPLPSVDSAVSG